MVRGVQYGSNVIAASDVSVSYARNLITEQAMGLGGEPSIYDGANIATGSIGAAYRTSLKPIATAINILISSASSTITTQTFAASDEFGGNTFASSFINSFELSMNVKEYGKCNMGFIATGLNVNTTPVSGGATYGQNDIPLFWASNISVGGTVSATVNGFSIKLEAPIDQDYYALGSKHLVDFVQNGNGNISGSLKFGAREWTAVQKGITSSNGVLGTIVLNLGSDGGASLGAITIEDAVASDTSYSGQGRSRFEKTVNFRAPCSSTKNNAIFGS